MNKQRRGYGETAEHRAKDRRGESPDRDLPVRDYQHLTIPQIKTRVGRLNIAGKRKVARYEKKHKNHKRVLELLG